MRLLLSSVFKPYAVDDDFGRKENIMELFHNQVTREQGVFSLRMNHPSGGLHLMAENLSVPTMVLDFPSLTEFEREVRKGYDVVGLSFITPNFRKAQHMARRVRELSPRTRIVLGGHGTNIPGLEGLIDADAICRGDGVSFMRAYFGEDTQAPIRHPQVPSAFNRRFLGVPLPGTSAMLFPGNGCPNACDFCSTSHHFQRQYVPFLKTGQEVFDACQDLEERMGAQEFFVLDENFLKYRDRAEALLALMERHQKRWTFGMFSSAESIQQYGLDTLTRLGIFFLWVGVESRKHVYAKNAGTDMKALIRRLRERGISVLTSGILFLDHHTPANIWEDVDYLVGLESDFVQFMQLGPLPTTELYLRKEAEGVLRHDIPFEEWHGQHQLWFDHPHFSREESEQLLRAAFERDFLVNGPSILRMAETYHLGYQALENATDPFLCQRRELLKTRMLDYRPAMPVLANLAPARSHRERARRLEAAMTRLVGPRTALDWTKASAVMAGALTEKARLFTLGSVRQPGTQWTPYRLAPVGAVEQLRSRVDQQLSLPGEYARGALGPALALLRDGLSSLPVGRRVLSGG